MVQALLKLLLTLMTVLPGAQGLRLLAGDETDF